MRLTVSSILTLSLCVLLLGNQLLIALPSLAMTDAETSGVKTSTQSTTHMSDKELNTLKEEASEGYYSILNN
jgi:hypothetical protein